ncbi:MAG: WbqC family protein [Maribacter sp.]
MKLIHPAYFPNIVTFGQIMHQPICWEVSDNYQKQTLRNRTYICTDRGKHMLSIPIVHVGRSNGRQKYKEVTVDNSYPWQRQHWRTLETAYRTSPYFEFYEDDIQPLYTNTFEKLMDFNLRTVSTIFECLQLDMPKKTTEGFEERPKTMEDYRHLVNAKTKLPTTMQPYVQVFNDRHGLIPNLSILDLLFNMGPNAVSYLKQEFIPTTDG